MEGIGWNTVSREHRAPFVGLLEVMVRETKYGEFDYHSTEGGFPLEAMSKHCENVTLDSP
jgi:hypothetical protein